MNQQHFDEWFFDIHKDGFALNYDYFSQAVSTKDEQRRYQKVKKWLELAFEKGRQSAIKEMK